MATVEGRLTLTELTERTEALHGHVSHVDPDACLAVRLEARPSRCHSPGATQPRAPADDAGTQRDAGTASSWSPDDPGATCAGRHAGPGSTRLALPSS